MSIARAKVPGYTANFYGNFALASTPGAGSYPFFVAAADVNGDGKPDLIAVNAGDNTLTVLTNNGTGGFVPASSPPAGTYPLALVAADVNGDGKPDLIAVNYSVNMAHRADQQR